jgi:cyclopropane-fatty-acyl-phospholipid synthase
VRDSSATLHAFSLALTLTDCSVLQNITVGRLRIVTNERIYEFPKRVTGSGKGNEPHAELRVINDAFWVRLCMMGDLGFAEAYMFGDVVCEDLISTFRVSALGFSLLSVQMNLTSCPQVFLENKRNLGSPNSTFLWLFSLPQRLTSFRFLNSLGNARSNISAHYDLSDDMFKGMLVLAPHVILALHSPSLFIRRYDLLMCHLL